MNQQTIIRHDIHSENGELVTQTGEQFDLVGYSKMKYGSVEDSRAMGIELGDYIIDNAPDFVYDPRKICAPFMFKHVPSAAYTIGRYAFSRINAARATEGLDRVHTRQIFINKQPNADYSKLDSEGRLEYMRESGLELITQPLDGYNVLMLDDIRITGTYSKLVSSLVGKYAIGTMLDAYWAAIDPVEAASDPSIENRINSSAGIDLNLIQEILETGQLVPTVRTLKLLLSHKNSEELANFMAKLPADILLEIYEGAAGTGYDLMQMYPENYSLLEKLVNDTSIIRASALIYKEMGALSLTSKAS